MSDPNKRRQYDQGGGDGQGYDFHHQPFDFDAFFGQGSDSNGFFDFSFDDLFGDDVFGDDMFGDDVFGEDVFDFSHGKDSKYSLGNA